MNDFHLRILENYGWQVDCENPLEISLTNEPESQASGRAAEILVNYLIGEWYERQGWK